MELPSLWSGGDTMALGRSQQEQIRETYFQKIEGVEPKDVHEAQDKGWETIERLQASGIPGTLKKLWNDIKLMLGLLRDYGRGEYRDVPWRIIAALVAAILYFASPIDIIPDFIPFIGYIDDALVVTFAVDLAREDLEKYRLWRQRNSK